MGELKLKFQERDGQCYGLASKGVNRRVWVGDRWVEHNPLLRIALSTNPLSCSLSKIWNKVIGNDLLSNGCPASVCNFAPSAEIEDKWGMKFQGEQSDWQQINLWLGGLMYSTIHHSVAKYNGLYGSGLHLPPLHAWHACFWDGGLFNLYQNFAIGIVSASRYSALKKDQY